MLDEDTLEQTVVEQIEVEPTKVEEKADVRKEEHEQLTKALEEKGEQFEMFIDTLLQPTVETQEE